MFTQKPVQECLYVCSTKIGEISDISKCFENFVSQTLGVLTRIYAAELRYITNSYYLTKRTKMERMRIKMLVALLLLCLSVSAQTEYSGIAGASPGMVRANKQAAAKQANRNSKAANSSNVSKPKTSNNGNANSNNSTYAPLPDNNESGETEVRDGFKTFSRGMGKVIKRETKTMGEVTRKIGADGKKFFKKLGKGISDSFKPDTTTSK